MATIVQNYGPIYGEVVNGTVQGRPNGSVYVPISNTIDVNLSFFYIKNHNASTLRLCNSAGTGKEGQYVAVAQDLASNVRVDIFDDSDLTNRIGTISKSAGLFNSTLLNFNTSDTIVADQTYYLVGYLMNNGSKVATSSTIELTGWSS